MAAIVPIMKAARAASRGAWRDVQAVQYRELTPIHVRFPAPGLPGRGKREYPETTSDASICISYDGARFRRVAKMEPSPSPRSSAACASRSEFLRCGTTSKPCRRSGHRGESYSAAQGGRPKAPQRDTKRAVRAHPSRSSPLNGPAQSTSGACGAPPRRAYPPSWSCGRVAEGGGLLNRYRVVKPYRGFESLRLRQMH